MNKRLVPIFVCSVISFIFSLVSIVGVGCAMSLTADMSDNVQKTDNSYDNLFALLGSMVIAVFIIAALIVFVITALFGVFGIMCALKNGRFSLACLILGSICTAVCGAAVISDIANEPDPVALISLLYFIGYTISSVIAFRYRKKISGYPIPNLKKG